MLRIFRSPVRLPARRPPARIRRRLSTPSRDWRVWAAFESRDEVQKVRLASLLFDLEAMAREKQPSPAAPAVDEPVSSLDALDMVRLPKVLSAGAALDTLDPLSRGDRLHPECLLRLLQQASVALAGEPPLLDLQAGDELDAMFRAALTDFPSHSPVALSTDPWVLQFEEMVSEEGGGRAM